MSAYFHAIGRPAAGGLAVTMGMLACGLSVAPWALAGHQVATGDSLWRDGKGDRKKAEGMTRAEAKPADKQEATEKAMQVYYLEIVTKDVDEGCAAFGAAGGVKFGKPDAGLGGARTAPMPGGGMVGVRAPMRETEAPVVRPYWPLTRRIVLRTTVAEQRVSQGETRRVKGWLVKDIKASVALDTVVAAQRRRSLRDPELRSDRRVKGQAVKPHGNSRPRHVCDLRPRRGGSWVVGEVGASR